MRTESKAKKETDVAWMERRRVDVFSRADFIDVFVNRFSHAIPPFRVGKWRQFPLRDLP